MSDHIPLAQGLAVFGPLRAEEEPWLAACFVPPTGFEEMAGPGSILVFGAPGGGKSALCRMVAAQAASPGMAPSWLVVHWRPAPHLWSSVTGFESVPGQVAHVFDLCALEVLRFLAYYPNQWEKASEWTRWLISWFVKRFLWGDPRVRAAELLEETPGREVVAGILNAGMEEDLLPPNDWRLVTAEVSKALQRLGLHGVWVMVDGLETWLWDSGRSLPAFISFLSTLPLFEEKTFAYKAFVPETFYHPLLSAEGVDRRRFLVHRLTWSEAQLRQIAERRLALATGQPEFPLKALCPSAQFQTWLRKMGGESPRVWLECLRPLVARYLETGRPVQASEWKKLRITPRVMVDEDNRTVFVGGRRIPMREIPTGALRILRYLYRNADRVVPWDELYYRGYRGMERIPRKGEPEYEPPDVYEQTLYSRLSDLRRIIEPDPRQPVCIETIRAEGVRLRACW